MNGNKKHTWLDDQEKALNKHGNARRGDNKNYLDALQERRNGASSNVYQPLPAPPTPNRKKIQRQKTLSMATPVLEELLQKINRLESKFEASCNTENKGRKSPNTLKKTPYPDSNDRGVPDDDGAHNDNIIARNLQVGNGNFMVFCENVDNRSERTYRQIGDKNVIININTSSNKCQILDHINNEVVPLDTEGEIWLEIKRRSLTDSSANCSDKTHSTPPSPSMNIQPSYPLNDLSGSSIKYLERARVPSRPRKNPIEHTDTYDKPIGHFDDCYDDDDPMYDKIVAQPGGRLSFRIPIPTENGDSSAFTRQNLQSFLDNDNVKQYLSAGGESFELSVCTWTYEREEVYSRPKKGNHSREGIYSRVASDDEPPQMPAPAPPVRQDGRVWYHETMDKRQAHTYLADRRNGAFIVRKATKPDRRHKYTIEFIDRGIIRRLKILQSEDGFHFEYSENKTFSTLDRLIEAIIHAGLEIKEDNGQWKNIVVFPV